MQRQIESPLDGLTHDFRAAYSGSFSSKTDIEYFAIVWIMERKILSRLSCTVPLDAALKLAK